MATKLGAGFIRRMATIGRLLDMRGQSQGPVNADDDQLYFVYNVAWKDYLRWAIDSGDNFFPLDGVSNVTVYPVDPTLPPPISSVYNPTLDYDVLLLAARCRLTYVDLATVAAEIAIGSRWRLSWVMDPIAGQIDDGELDIAGLQIPNYVAGQDFPGAVQLQAGLLEYNFTAQTLQSNSSNNPGISGWRGFVPAGFRFGMRFQYSGSSGNARDFPAGTKLHWTFYGLKALRGMGFPF